MTDSDKSAWNAKQNPATTLSGYGITDAFPLAGGTLVGTGGNGYVGLPNQSSDPATPSSGVNIFSDASGRFSWKSALGYRRTFRSLTLTADRLYTLPDADGTIAFITDLPVAANPTVSIGLTANNGSATTFMRSDATPALALNITPTWTSTHTFNKTPAATTNNGVVNIGDGAFDGTTSGFFAGGGTSTYVAVNAALGFTGSMMELQIAGTSLFRLNSGGTLGVKQRFVVGQTNASSALLHLASGSAFTTSAAFSTGGFGFRADLQTFESTNATGTTVNNMGVYTFGTPTLTSTVTPVTLTSATNIYIQGAATAGTGVTIGTAYALYINAGTSWLGGGLIVPTRTALNTTAAGSSVLFLGNTGFSTGTNFSATGMGIGVAACTYTTTTLTTTVAVAAANSFGIPTFVNSAGAQTHTNAATVYIAGAPVASTNISITAPYSLYIAQGTTAIGGGFTTNPNSYFVGNLFTTPNTGASGNTTTTTTGLLFASASSIQLRVGINGTNSTTMTAGVSYSQFIIGQGATITTASSGVHGLFAQQVINPLAAITTGLGSTVTNTATLYLNGAGSATVTGSNYNLWANGGTNRLDGTNQFSYSSKAGDPTTTEVPTGTYMVWLNTSTGTMKVWVNQAGTLKSTTLS